MIPFYSNLGAAGWVERNAVGLTCVLLVQPINRKTIKLHTLRVVYENTGDKILGAQPVEVSKHA